MKNYFKTLWNNPAAARKFWLAVIAAVVMIASQGLLGPEVLEYTNTIIPVLTALGVYAVRNDTPINTGTRYSPPLETRGR